jgi:hypothetical protein
MAIDQQRHPAASMFERTVHEAAEEQGGRFARNTEISIAGTGPIPHAEKLAGPEWSQDHVPPEEPLGYCIDEVPDQTTVSGIDRAQLAPVPEEPTDDE